jgi:hypothetical protein
MSTRIEDNGVSRCVFCGASSTQSAALRVGGCPADGDASTGLGLAFRPTPEEVVPQWDKQLSVRSREGEGTHSRLLQSVTRVKCEAS